jgi:glycosyltransferase involved in cell wall biosynthesis
MKIGLFAWSTDTGLGNQCWEFYKHIRPETVLISDLSRFNNMPTHHERYPGARIANGIPNDQEMEWLVDNSDVIFICETPLNYHLFWYAKRQGKKIIQQYNYEFWDYFEKPDLAAPAMLAAPSTWNTEIVRDAKIAPVMQWPVPVNRDLIPFRKIEFCKTFVHIIGRPAINDRNGTMQFLEAARRLGNSFNYIIYRQPPTDPRAVEYHKPILEMIETVGREVSIQLIDNVDNYADMYASGDVLVLPRRYGGLCLPMQEALSAGMPVVMTDISPNEFLPHEWRVDSKRIGKFYAHTFIDIYEANVDHLVERMGKFHESWFMQWSNNIANELAEKISWKNLAPWYLEQMELLHKQNDK